ncbi:ABC transporter permease [Chloroflexota bacterium]
MYRILVVALREVHSYLRDKGDLAFSLLLPIAIFTLMYGAFGGESLFHGTAYIVNEDQGGTYSTRLIERLDELDNLEVALLSWSEANAKLERSDVLLVVFILEDFSTQLDSGWSTQIIFRQRGSGGQEGQVVAGLVRGIADEMSQEIQMERQIQRALDDKVIGRDHIQTTVQKLLDRERESPIVKVSEEIIGTEVNQVNQFLPGIVTMFVLFAITLGSRALVEERKKGTLERLLTTRLSVGQLYMGKFTAGVARGFIQMFILLTLAYAVFQFFTPFSFIMILLVALIFTAAASTLGLLIASVARTEDQAVWMSVFFTMATVMLGGTFFEIPEDSAIYVLSRISINTYANDAFRTMIAQGGSLTDVSFELAVLATVIVVGLVLSRIMFKVVPGGI